MPKQNTIAQPSLSKKLTSKGRGYAPTCVTRIKFVFSIVKPSSCCAQRAVVTGQAISEPN